MLAPAIQSHIEFLLVELFWELVKRDGDRLDLLRIFAAQPVTRSTDWDCAAVRQEAATSGGGVPEACFSCRSGDRKLYWHHVIQIQHGGSNKPRNRVAICYRCHAAIHPWLPKERKGEQRGGEWYSLGEILEDAQQQHKTGAADVSETVEVETREEPAS